MPKKTLDPTITEGIPGMFYGGKRDVIEVEIVDIDGEPFTSNMRSSDAIRDIYMGAFKLDKNNIIGVQVAWKGRPVPSGSKIGSISTPCQPNLHTKSF